MSDQPTPHDVANRLRELAERFDTLDPTTPMPRFFLTGLSSNSVVDTIGEALFGQPGQLRNGTSGWEYAVQDDSRPIKVRIWNIANAPASEDPAQLRAEIDRLRAQISEQQAVDEDPTGGYDGPDLSQGAHGPTGEVQS